MNASSWPSTFVRLRRSFWLLLLLTIGYMIWLKSYLSPLRSDEIVQFEIARTVDRAQHIIDDWKITGKYEMGVRSITFAYLFIVLYTLAIALGCRFVSACTGNEILMKGGRAFSWLVLVAAICDVIEIGAMSRTLTGHVSQLNVSVAYNLARIKFSIVIVCILFMIASALYWLIGQLVRDK